MRLIATDRADALADDDLELHHPISSAGPLGPIQSSTISFVDAVNDAVHDVGIAPAGDHTALAGEVVTDSTAFVEAQNMAGKHRRTDSPARRRALSQAPRVQIGSIGEIQKSFA